MVGNLILVLLGVYRSLQQWKNFANRSRIDKVIAMFRVAPFLTHGVVVHYWADLQSVHGFRCYDNTTQNAKC